jgi:hypothetical protein
MTGRFGKSAPKLPDLEENFLKSQYFDNRYLQVAKL